MVFDFVRLAKLYIIGKLRIEPITVIYAKQRRGTKISIRRRDAAAQSPIVIVVYGSKFHSQSGK